MHFGAKTEWLIWALIASHYLFVLWQGSSGDKYDKLCEIILDATDKLTNSMGDAAVMVKQARLLAEVWFRSA